MSPHSPDTVGESCTRDSRVLRVLSNGDFFRKGGVASLALLLLSSCGASPTEPMAAPKPTASTAAPCPPGWTFEAYYGCVAPKP